LASTVDIYDVRTFFLWQAQ